MIAEQATADKEEALENLIEAMRAECSQASIQMENICGEIPPGTRKTHLGKRSRYPG